MCHGGIANDGTANSKKNTRIRSRYSAAFGAIYLTEGTVIRPREGYKVNIAVYKEYTSNNNFILKENTGMITEPYTLEEDSYVRFGIGTENDDELWEKDEEGTVTYTASGEAALVNAVTVNIATNTVKKKIAELENRSIFDGSIILEMPVEVTRNSKTTDYHALFDDWVEQGLLERELLGNVSTEELPIFLYTLRNNHDHVDPNYNLTKWNGNNDLYERDKIFLTSGVHGNERATPYALYNFIRCLLNDDSYAYLRDAYDWYIVPIVNPYGFDHDQRRNEDDIDINRDLETLATREAQLVTSAMARNHYKFYIDSHQAQRVAEPNCAFLSLHYGATEEERKFIYNAWMQSGAPIQNIFAEKYGKDAYTQTIAPWEGTNLATFRNFGAQYAEYSMCYESNRACKYYSGTTELYNKIAADFVSTTYCLFLKKLCTQQKEEVSESEEDIETLVATRKAEFNSNANAKINTFNSNAGQRMNEYNNNHALKLAEYNANADEVINTNTAISDLIDSEFDNGTASDTKITVSDSAKWNGKLGAAGNTKQKQLSGKNFLYNNTYSRTQDGLTITKKENGKIVLNGTATADGIVGVSNQSVPMQRELLLNKSIILNGCPAGGTSTSYKLRLYNYSGDNTYVDDIGNGTPSVTFNNANSNFNISIMYYAGATFNNLVFEPMIRLSSVDDTTYEQYCGGQSAPNSRYPREIHTVKGYNVIKHVGKNRFNIDALVQGVWNNGNTNQRLVGFFAGIVQGQKCTVQCFNSALKFSCVVSSENKISNTATATDDTGWITSKKRTITASQDGYVVLQISKLDNSVITQQEISATDFQIEIGDTETSYELYKEEKYELDLRGDNKFDGIFVNGNLNSSSGNIDYQTWSIATKNLIRVKPNTTYNFSCVCQKTSVINRIAKYDAEGNFIARTDTLDTDTYTTDNDTYFIRFNLYSDPISPEDVVSATLEESSATEHTAYDLIELCEIGDHKDIIFKNESRDENYNAELRDDAWYIKKEFDKYIFDGTETFERAATSTTGVYRLKTTVLAELIKKYENSSVAEVCCSHYISTTSNSNYNCSCGISVDSNGAVFIYDSNYNDTDCVNLYKTFLESNNIVLYFRRENAAYVEITDATLISQLEALNKVGMYHGVNNFYTEAQDLEPALDLKYKISNKIKNEEQNARLENIESRLALLENEV